MRKTGISIIGAFSIILASCSTSNTSIPPEDKEEESPPQEIQSHTDYQLNLISDTSNIAPDVATTLIYKIENNEGETLKEFETVHEKIMHFILVRHDLQEFQHLHPEFNENNGEFSVEITFPSEGKYRIFPDFTPGKAVNPQRLPATISQDLQVGKENNEATLIADKEFKKKIGEYELDLKIPTLLETNKPINFTLDVIKNGQPVTNLEKYLGALGHSVILKAETLDFIHTHAIEDSTSGSKINFATAFPEAGLYKIFIQFQHEGEVVTTDYVVSVAKGSEEVDSTSSNDHQMPNMIH